MSERRSATVVIAMLVTIASARELHGAGLYVSDRGTRPLGRGGAFVAGADDGGAIWYNPAGLADAPTSLLVDAAWVDYGVRFSRRSLVTTTSGTELVDSSFPQVNGSTPFLPIPTIVGTYRFGAAKEYTVALGAYAPYAAILSYPESINGGPAPQRYSLLSLDGSALAVVGAWFAYRPIEQLHIGIGIQMLTGYFRTTIVFNTCPPGRLFCAEEDPSYDAQSAVSTGPIFAPSGNAGITWIPIRGVRLAASAQAPFQISAPATVDVRLPSAVFFDGATQSGRAAHTHFELPPILRVGIEVRPLHDDRLRVELAYAREFWSVQKSIDVTPENIRLINVLGFPSPFQVSAISLPRAMRDSDSVHLGGEYDQKLFQHSLTARAGVSYETSALPTAYVTPLTVDSDKVAVSLGGSIYANEHLRLDVAVSHAIASGVTVTPQEAAVPRITVVKGNPAPPTTAVNGGIYSYDTTVVGVGMNYVF
jgi:long-chain fatty acid transport protein